MLQILIVGLAVVRTMIEPAAWTTIPPTCWGRGLVWVESLAAVGLLPGTRPTFDER